MTIRRILIIAGSDSGGGAGIQADIKAVAALGGHGMTVITALTAQNTLGVQAVHPVPLDFVKAQFDSVVGDMGVDAVKTGMLHSAELVELVADLIKDLKVPVVVDPVMVAKGGDRLLAQEAVEAVRKRLLPLATVVTPNLDEVSELLGNAATTTREMEEAARALVELGAGAALVKGGHLVGEPMDVLYDGRGLRHFAAPRLDTPHTHGTGCTLASALATLLAQEVDLKTAVERARLLVRRAISGALAIGGGHGPINAMAALAPDLAMAGCLAEMDQALERLVSEPGLTKMIPEVRGQLGYALPGAQSFEEVLGVAGRITNIGDRLVAAGPVRLGASRHVARIILTAMGHDPSMRAAMALKYDPAILKKARSLGWSVAEFSRSLEPADLKAREGSSLEWGTSQVIRTLGSVPRVIYDTGEVGKEPVIRLLGQNPGEVVDGVLALARTED